MQQPIAQGLQSGAIGAGGVEEFRDRPPERAARSGAQREERIERVAARRLGGASGLALEQIGFAGGSEIENIVPDRDAAARAPPGGLNTPSGKFWIGKSACRFAEPTQLRRAGACVVSCIRPA